MKVCAVLAKRKYHMLGLVKEALDGTKSVREYERRYVGVQQFTIFKSFYIFKYVTF